MPSDAIKRTGAEGWSLLQERYIHFPSQASINIIFSDVFSINLNKNIPYEMSLKKKLVEPSAGIHRHIAEVEQNNWNAKYNAFLAIHFLKFWLY